MFLKHTIVERKDVGLTSFRRPTPQFSTARVSLYLALPLEDDASASVRALVSSLISRVTREYPDYTAFGRYLQSLYGASLHAGVNRIGDNQILNISASGIANRYAFDGEDVEHTLGALLEDILFTPLFAADGHFPEDGFRQEKRQLIETLEAEFNEKRIYAKSRAAELLFAGEPAGVSRLGTRASLENVRREDVTASWKHLMAHAQVLQFSFGDSADSRLSDRFAERLGARETVSIVSGTHTPKTEPVCVTEEMPLAQSKLVLGFGMDSDPKKRLANRMLAIVFGGTPSSKLFLSVREKQSLCYYCSAQHETQKNVMFVQSGVETSNLERAQEAILHELEAIQKGEVTDEELLHARLALKTSCTAVEDSAAAMEGWYLGGMLSGDLRTPEEYADAAMRVTKDEIVEAAQRVTLDTVYRLKGVTEG